MVEMKPIPKDLDPDDLLFFGRVVVCSGFCSIHCTMPLWICTNCFHIECECCIDDYTIDFNREFNISICRRCGKSNTYSEFARASKFGIHWITEEERTIPNSNSEMILSYSQFHFSFWERIRWELRRIYERVRYYNPKLFVLPKNIIDNDGLIVNE
jgi:hypothetical protein